MSFDWKSIVKTVAPMLGTALGGPFGGIAGAAIAKALGTPDANPDTLSAAIQNATPEQLAAIQKIEDDFKAQMAQMGFADTEALEKIAADDRASARDMEKTTHDVWTPRILSAVIVVGFLVCVFYVLSGKVTGLTQPGIAAMIGTLIGYVSAKADAVYSFYFGASSSDHTTAQMLYNSTPTDGSSK